MNDRDYWTVEAMIRYGGSFVSNLGRAILHADPQNLEKIKEAFPEYWDEYEELGKSLQIDNQYE